MRARRLLRFQYGHARVHYHETGHAMMRAKTMIGRGFVWCYADNRYVGERESEAASSGA